MLEKFDKNSNPFKVPENYFENFNAEIMTKLPAKETQKKVIPMWKKVFPWTAVAAALFGVLFMTGVFRQGTGTTGQTNIYLSSGIASNSVEEDYFLFLEDEVSDAYYKEIMFSN
ncbi:hypothetical protein [Dysgonomonas sp. Marseille-P4361]|uniref:hypothetical protein n=1 Tax=Dysgonomonas sp. Marseille-P4361 TaxID=2161820 RepID=UPI000D559502|nr:hypothetical protein [Dysgonomonas sp. Marseille-P4361]